MASKLQLPQLKIRCHSHEHQERDGRRQSLVEISEKAICLIMLNTVQNSLFSFSVNRFSHFLLHLPLFYVL